MLKGEQPISLNSLRFSDKNGAVVVVEEYSLTFCDHETTEIFIQNRYKYWKELLSMDLFLAPDANETMKEIEIKKVFRLVAGYFRLPFKDVVSRSRKGDYIEARRIAINICLECKVMKTTIGKTMGYSHATIIHHERKHRDFMETDHAYTAMYEDISDVIAPQLNKAVL